MWRENVGREEESVLCEGTECVCAERETGEREAWRAGSCLLCVCACYRVEWCLACAYRILCANGNKVGKRFAARFSRRPQLPN